MRARFDSSYIRLELERIGQQLDDPLTVFLIDGGSMAFRGLKEMTDSYLSSRIDRFREYRSASREHLLDTDWVPPRPIVRSL
jgi:hypothetical protein